MDARQLVVNARHVVHETIDGETILIHLGTGVYYSLDGAGATMWGLIADGTPAAEVTAALEAVYPADDSVAPAVTALLDSLVEEDLLIEGVAVELPETVSVTDARSPFVAPALKKYTDMQQFMLVDPLHEVDEQAGWPNVAAG